MCVCVCAYVCVRVRMRAPALDPRGPTLCACLPCNGFAVVQRPPSSAPCRARHPPTHTRPQDPGAPHQAHGQAVGAHAGHGAGDQEAAGHPHGQGEGRHRVLCVRRAPGAGAEPTPAHSLQRPGFRSRSLRRVQGQRPALLGGLHLLRACTSDCGLPCPFRCCMHPSVCLPA